MKAFTPLLFLLLVVQVSVQAGSGWKRLFNGKNLKGWELKGDSATFQVKKGEIIGKTVPNRSNSFLCTKNEYVDFILEYEAWIDPSITSGVQIRSNSEKPFKKGLVHGYQVKLDPGATRNSGGIYDEGRRGWLYPLSMNPTANSAFKNGEWNKFRVEVSGDIVKTWVNSIQCAFLVDDKNDQGFIGLMIPAIDNKDQEGKVVKWRDIRIKTKQLDEEWTPTNPTVPQISYLENQLTDWEEAQGWKMLWDGATTSGWKGIESNGFPESHWELRNGELTIIRKHPKERPAGGTGDIMTEDEFGNFELELDFKISEGANSGVMYFVGVFQNDGISETTGCEFQIVDDDRHPDGYQHENKKRLLASLHDMIPPKETLEADPDELFKGVGKWNKIRIIAHGGKVEHWLNNEKVVEYDRFSPAFQNLRGQSRYSDWEDYGQLPKGQILLENNGQIVHFRSIKIREHPE